MSYHNIKSDEDNMIAFTSSLSKVFLGNINLGKSTHKPSPESDAN
jgi:hypothetical protein